MVKTAVLLLSLFTPACAFAAGASGSFASFDGSVYDRGGEDIASAVAVDTITAGGPYVYSAGSSFNGSNYDYFIVKYSPAGAVLATKVFDGGPNDYAQALALDPARNSVYVTGYSNRNSGDYLTIKCDLNLNLTRAVYFNSGGYDYAYGVAVDAAGEVYVTGKSSSAVSKGWDALTLRYSSALTLLSSAAYNGPYNDDDLGLAVKVDAQGRALVAGRTNTFDSGWKNKFLVLRYASGLGAAEKLEYFDSGDEPETNVKLALDKNGNSYFNYQVFGSSWTHYIVKLDAGLAYDTRWEAGAYLHPVQDLFYEPVSDLLYVIGESSNPYSALRGQDYYLASYDTAGAQQARVYYDSGLDDRARGVAADHLGNVYAIGHSSNGTNADLRTINAQNIFAKAPPQLDWTGEPLYLTSGLNPASGNNMTAYAFRVKYTDTDPVAPPDIQRLTVTPDSLTALLSPSDAGDTNYADGKIYAYTTRLSSSVGQQSYEFTATDRFRKTSSLVGSGPLMSALDLLWPDGVSSGTLADIDGVVSGSARADEAQAVAVDTITPSGPYIYAAGYTFNGVNNDLLLLKYGPTGTVLSTAVFNFGANEYGRSIALDIAGNRVYAAGSAASDYLLLKCDLALNYISSVTYDGGGEDAAYGVAVGPAGDVYVTGAAYTPGSGDNVFTIKYSPALVALSSSTFDDATYHGTDAGQGVKVAPDGKVFVAGQTAIGAGAANNKFLILGYDQDLNLQGNEIYSIAMATNTAVVAVDDKNGVYLAAKGRDFIAKYDYLLNGPAVWTASGPVAALSYEPASSLLYAGGMFSNGFDSDQYLVEYTTAGELTGTGYYESGYAEDLRAIAAADAENIYMAGRTSIGSGDIRLLNSNGMVHKTAPQLDWTGEPGYAAAGVFPSSGSYLTDFTFRVKYTDADGVAPLHGTPRLNILTGSVVIADLQMAEVPGGSYAGGKFYTVTTKISAPLGRGYNYKFLAANRLYKSDTLAAAGPDILFGQSSGTFLQEGGVVSDSGGQDTPVAIAIDTVTAGGPYIYTVGDGNASATGNDILVFKYDPAGTVVSTAVFNWGYGAHAYGIAVDPVNQYVYIAGEQNGYWVVVQCDADLTYLRQDNQYLGAARSVDVSPAGDVYVTGNIRGLFNYDLATVRYNSSLGTVNSASYNDLAVNGNGHDYGDMVKAGSNGSVYVSGRSRNANTNDKAILIRYAADLSGQVITRYNVVPSAAVLTLDAANNVYFAPIGFNTVFKFAAAFAENASYTAYWTAPGVTALAYDPVGDRIYVGGETTDGQGGQDQYIYKFDPATGNGGSPVSKAMYDSGQDDHTAALAADQNGDIYIIGRSSAGANGNFRTRKALKAVYPVLDFAGGTHPASGVYPGTGTYGTEFVFRVKYTNADNMPPMGLAVGVRAANMENVSSSPFLMRAEDPGDLDYTDGKIYISTMTLHRGYYYHYFINRYATVTGAPAGNQSGPVVDQGLDTGDFSGYDGVASQFGAADQALAVAVDTITAGGPYIYSAGSSFNGMNYDTFIIKYGPSGAVLARKFFDQALMRNEYARAIAVDPYRNSVYFGADDEYNAIVLKYDLDLNYINYSLYNSPSNGVEKLNGIAFSPSSGDVYITGETNGYAPWTPDVYTVRFNSGLGQLGLAVYNGTSGNVDKGQAIAVDDQGRVLVAGRTNVDDSGWKNKFLFLRYPANLGAPEKLEYGNSGDEPEVDLKIALDNTGHIYFNYPVLSGGVWNHNLVQLDSTLTPSLGPWQVGFSTEPVRALAYSPDANLLYVGGETPNRYSAQRGLDYYISKYNPSGMFAGRVYYDSGREDNLRGIASDQLGNIYVTGYGDNGTDEDIRTLNAKNIFEKDLPKLAWSGSFDSFDGTLIGSGGDEEVRAVAVDTITAGGPYIYAAGSYNGTSYADGAYISMDSDVLLVKYDSAGTVLSTAVFNLGANEYGRGLALDVARNSVYAVGNMASGFSLLLKYDLALNYVSSAAYDMGNDDISYGVSVGPAGDVYVAGDTSAGLTRYIYVMKYSSGLTLLNAVPYHDPDDNGDDIAKAIKVGADGSVFVGGVTNTFDGVFLDKFLVLKYDAGLGYVNKAKYDVAVATNDAILAIDDKNGIYLAAKGRSFVARYNYALDPGPLVWTTTHPVRALDYEPVSGLLYAGGAIFNGFTDDHFLLEYTTAGEITASIFYDSGREDDLGGIAAVSSTTVYLAGTDNKDIRVLDSKNFVQKAYPQLAWTGEAGYLNGGISPERVQILSSPARVIFRLKYTDAGNISPLAGCPHLYFGRAGSPLIIDGSSMTEVDAGDVNYTDGKLYAYTLDANLPEGSYSYEFRAKDRAWKEISISSGGPEVVPYSYAWAGGNTRGKLQLGLDAGLTIDSGRVDEGGFTVTDATSPGGPYVYVAGSYNNGVDNDIFVVKYNSAGVALSTAVFSGGSTETAKGIALDSVNGFVYVAAQSSLRDAGDYMLIKYDLDLKYVKYSTYDKGAGEYAQGVAVAPDGSVLVTGYNDANFVLTARFDTDLNLSSAASFGGYFPSFAYGVVCDTQGAVYVTGSVWYNDFWSNGWIDGASRINKNALLLKYDAGLNFVFAKDADPLNNNPFYFDGDAYSSADEFRGAAVDSLTPGGPYIYAAGRKATRVISLSGSRVYDYDLWTVKYDIYGTLIDSATFAEDGRSERAYSVAVDSLGFVYAAGSSGAFGQQPQYLTLKFDTMLNRVYRDVYAGAVGQAYSVATDSAGRIYAAGTSAENIGVIVRRADSVNSPPTFEFSSGSRGLSPGLGTEATAFVYSVVYFDPNNDAPSAGYPLLYVLKEGRNIAGSPFGMSYVSGQPVTGSRYSLPLNLPAGAYTYYFAAKDLPGQAATGLPAALAKGPRVQKVSGDFLSGGALYDGGAADEPRGVAVDTAAAGGPFVYAVGDSYNLENNDFQMLKYDAMGRLLSSATFDSGGEDNAYAVCLDTAGNVYVAGSYKAANWNYLTLKYSPDLVLLASAAYDRGRDDFARGIAFDGATGLLYVTGMAMSARDYDFATAQYDAGLNYLQAKIHDEGYEDKAYGVAVSSLGVYVTGESYDGTAWKALTVMYNKNMRPLFWHSAGSLLGREIVATSSNVYVSGLSGDDLAINIYDAYLTAETVRTLKYPRAGADPIGLFADEKNSAITLVSSKFVVRYGPGHNLAAKLDLAGSGLGTAAGSALDPAGNIYLTGRPAAAQDFHTVRYALAAADRQNLVSAEFGAIKADLEIPAGTFSEDVFISIIPAVVPEGREVYLKSTGIGLEITAEGGRQPGADLTLTINYSDAEAAGRDEKNFVLGRYEAGTWALLPTQTYPAENKLVGKLNHFSRFAVLEMVAVSGLGSIKVYPNPYKPGSGGPYDDSMHGEGIVFSGLPSPARVKIFDISGELVWRRDAESPALLIWDTKNLSGRKAGSGVYIYSVEDIGGKGRTVQGRLAIIR